MPMTADEITLLELNARYQGISVVYAERLTEDNRLWRELANLVEECSRAAREMRSTDYIELCRKFKALQAAKHVAELGLKSATKSHAEALDNLKAHKGKMFASSISFPSIP